jgi:hypothetical protein
MFIVSLLTLLFHLFGKRRLFLFMLNWMGGQEVSVHDFAVVATQATWDFVLKCKSYISISCCRKSRSSSHTGEYILSTGLVPGTGYCSCLCFSHSPSSDARIMMVLILCNLARFCHLLSAYCDTPDVSRKHLRWKKCKALWKKNQIIQNSPPIFLP